MMFSLDDCFHNAPTSKASCRCPCSQKFSADGIWVHEIPVSCISEACSCIEFSESTPGHVAKLRSS
jgi:hypothetical protein